MRLPFFMEKCFFEECILLGILSRCSTFHGTPNWRTWLRGRWTLQWGECTRRSPREFWHGALCRQYWEHRRLDRERLQANSFTPECGDAVPTTPHRIRSLRSFLWAQLRFFTKGNKKSSMRRQCLFLSFLKDGCGCENWFYCWSTKGSFQSCDSLKMDTLCSSFCRWSLDLKSTFPRKCSSSNPKSKPSFISQVMRQEMSPLNAALAREIPVTQAESQ